MLIRVTVRDNDKIPMIKLVRTLTNYGLKEAKDFVEARLANIGDTILVRVENPSEALARLINYDRWQLTFWTPRSKYYGDLITLEIVAPEAVSLVI